MSRNNHCLPRSRAALAFLLLVLTPISVLCQTSDAPVYPPPGNLIDVGGYRLHLYCIGAGRPAVLMVAGLNDYSIDWGLVQPEVARFTRACAYDRAGYAWSDRDVKPRSLQRAVDELYALVRNVQLDSPLVLVGHSWGGYIVRVFASQHPEWVAGMVLVDSPHEDDLEVINGKPVRPRLLTRQQLLALFAAEMKAMSAQPSSAPSAGNVQAPAKAAPAIRPPYDRLPADLQKRHLWAQSKGLVHDVSDFQEPLLLVHSTRAHSRHPLGDKPLIVLSKGIPEDFPPGTPEAKWALQLHQDQKRLQADLATLSRNSRQIVATHSGHHIQLEEPQRVIDAIRQVVEAVRNGSKLTPKDP